MPTLGLLLFAATSLVLVAVTTVMNDFTQNRTLVITSHESLSHVFVDGVEQPLPNANEKNVTDNVTVQYDARLIGVQAVSTIDFCAGFIGSVTNNYMVTDGSWKCSEFGAPKWFELGFDDSSWPNAYVLGRNGNVTDCPNLPEYIPEIGWMANWIWTQQETPTVRPRSDGDPMADRAVFCRGYLPFCQTYFPCANGGTCLENSELLCACPPEWTGRQCEKAKYRTLKITGKSTLYDVYVDGVRQSNLSYANNWTYTDEVVLSPINRLIAVMAIDSTETCAGVIGSITEDFLVTDASWRCSYVVEPQWYKLGWDDTWWPPAYIVGPNHNVTWPAECQILTGIPSISPDAYWIWTDTIPTTPDYHQTIYCRGYLPLCELESPCLNGGTCNRNNMTLCSCLLGYIGDYCETVDFKSVSLTAKETLYAAYVDGNPISLENGTDWHKSDSLSVFSVSRLLAIMAIRLQGTCPGILASVTDSNGDYVLTNATWKCSSSAKVGWAELGYDDSTWQAATLIHKNEFINDTQCYTEFIEIHSISSNAYWIWTNNPTGQDVVVYCRGLLPICDVHPCKNGATCNDNKVELCTCAANYTGKYCESQISSNMVLSRYNEHHVASGQNLDDAVIPDSADSNPALRSASPSAPIPAPNQKSDSFDWSKLRKSFRKDKQEGAD